MTSKASSDRTLTVKVTGFDDWRREARRLLAQQVAPEGIRWTEADSSDDLFGAEQTPADLFASDGIVSQSDGLPGSAGAISSVHQKRDQVDPNLLSGRTTNSTTNAARIPRELMALFEAAACHQNPQRWSLLYVVLWRWQRGERDVVSAADPDGAQLHGMVKAVRREEHDMHAYVRFRERLESDGPPRFVAWFEPTHHVLPQVAQHFAKRMGRVTWMIATPSATVMWDGEQLHFTGPLLKSAADIDDAGESLWLTYYRSIFNPARLNPQVMHGHLPTRFWKNLPEGAIVPQMIADAAVGARRVGQASSVGQRDGRVIAISAAAAQPQRASVTTLDQCRRCNLWERATQAVPGVGPETARLMLLGEQPGDSEDIAGQPFIGPAGQLLDRALVEAGLDRSTLYLTNAVKHFKWEPSGKRRLHKTPGKTEMAACRHWLDEELARIQPRVVLTLGSTALKSLIGHDAKLAAHIGTPVLHAGRWVVATWHPSYVLRLQDSAAKSVAFLEIVGALKKAHAMADAQI